MPFSARAISDGKPFSSTSISVSGKSNCIAPRFLRFFRSMSASSSIVLSAGTISLYVNASSALPSSNAVTLLYVNLYFERITDFSMLCLKTSPLLLISIKTDSVSLSAFGFKLHNPFEIFSGSIGMTLSARYTLVPLLYASLSGGEFKVT